MNEPTPVPDSTPIPVLRASRKRLTARFYATLFAAVSALLTGLPTILPDLKNLLAPGVYAKVAAACGIIGFVWLAVQRGLETQTGATHEVNNSPATDTSRPPSGETNV